MIKESATCSAIAAIATLSFGLAFDVDFTTIWHAALFFAAVPFLVAMLFQYQVVRAVAQSKIEWLFDQDFNQSGAIGDVILRRPVYQPVPKPAEVIRLPEPERVRLVPVKSLNNSANVALDAQLSPTETLRTVPVNVPTLVDQADEKDLLEFIDGLTFRGHSRRSWLGVKLPSGRVVDADYHNRLVGPLVKCGAIVDRSDRKAGKLVMESAEIKTRLGLAGSTG